MIDLIGIFVAIAVLTLGRILFEAARKRLYPRNIVEEIHGRSDVTINVGTGSVKAHCILRGIDMEMTRNDQLLRRYTFDAIVLEERDA